MTVNELFIWRDVEVDTTNGPLTILRQGKYRSTSAYLAADRSGRIPGNPRIGSVIKTVPTDPFTLQYVAGSR